MHCSQNVKFLLLMLAMLLQPLPGVADEFGIDIEDASLRNKNHHYVLDADIAYRLTPKVLKTLQHGISLTWVLHLQIFRLRRYWWDECIADIRRFYRIRYQALMNVYQVVDESRGEADYFSTLPASLEAIGTIRDLPLAEVPALDKNAKYRARIDLHLDREALPLPLRPLSYVSSDWYLSSGWYSWSVTQ
jgi:hypothetical protein